MDEHGNPLVNMEGDHGNQLPRPGEEMPSRTSHFAPKLNCKGPSTSNSAANVSRKILKPHTSTFKSQKITKWFKDSMTSCTSEGASERVLDSPFLTQRPGRKRRRSRRAPQHTIGLSSANSRVSQILRNISQISELQHPIMNQVSLNTVITNTHNVSSIFQGNTSLPVEAEGTWNNVKQAHMEAIRYTHRSSFLEGALENDYIEDWVLQLERLPAFLMRLASFRTDYHQLRLRHARDT